MMIRSSYFGEYALLPFRFQSMSGSADFLWSDFIPESVRFDIDPSPRVPVVSAARVTQADPLEVSGSFYVEATHPTDMLAELPPILWKPEVVLPTVLDDNPLVAFEGPGVPVEPTYDARFSQLTYPAEPRLNDLPQWANKPYAPSEDSTVDRFQDGLMINL